MNLHAKLKDAILERDECNITAIFLYRWPYTRIQKLFDHQDRLVIVVFILCEQAGTQVSCIFRVCILILSHHVDNCKCIDGVVVLVANVVVLKGLQTRIPASGLLAACVTIGKPLAKKSMITANISGFMIDQSASSCFDTVMKSLAKNTPRTPSMRNNSRAVE